jgi:hypothetical protein
MDWNVWAAGEDEKTKPQRTNVASRACTEEEATEPLEAAVCDPERERRSLAAANRKPVTASVTD